MSRSSLEGLPLRDVGDQSAPQRWAVLAAWGALACTLPSAVWRLLMIAGIMPGTERLRVLHADEVTYVVGLSLTQLVVSALVLGLVQPLSERLAGVPVPRWLPVVVGTAGGLLVTWLFTVDLPATLLSGGRPDQGTVDGGPFVVMAACYAPIVLWGPLILVAMLRYALRRR